MELKGTINRRGFGLKKEILPLLEESYHSSLIERIKTSNYELAAGDLVICLAQEFGFCYGVDRAVDLAYETRKRFPDRNIYLTSEIIHNPRVNTKLRELGIKFLKMPDSAVIASLPATNLGRRAKQSQNSDIAASALRPPRNDDITSGGVFDDIQEEDVVLIPAFGTPTWMLDQLKAKNCILVDTTCGSVVAVWRRVEQYAQSGFTAVIHGKFDHEETQATCSRAGQYPAGKFLVVRDKDQARKICDLIQGTISRETFLSEFQQTSSPGFDPDRDLERVGCANQTTMLSSESLEIADMIQTAMKARYGEAAVGDHFRHFDTICSATQDRQDAVSKLARSGIDLMMIVGGYNSSNTGHLCEIASEFCPAFHVQDSGEIISREEIRHKPAWKTERTVTCGWLPSRKARVGITAGASTPNRVIEEVILKIISVSDIKGI